MTTNKEAVSNKKLSQIIKNYYSSIIEDLNDIEKESFDELDPQFVTLKVIKSHKELERKFPNGIPYNPFLCAQDYPDDASQLNIEVLEESDNSVQFNVVIFTGWGPIEVSLVKDGEDWKIDEISCSKGNKL